LQPSSLTAALFHSALDVGRWALSVSEFFILTSYFLLFVGSYRPAGSNHMS